MDKSPTGSIDSLGVAMLAMPGPCNSHLDQKLLIFSNTNPKEDR